MSVGKNIKQLREQYDLTQEELASKIYVTRNAISKWENDKGIPSVDSLKELSSVFNVTLDMLLDREELIEITLENRENSIIVRNLVFSFILFLVFSSIGILIPYYSFEFNPTSGIAVFAIFLPLSYIILGLVSGLLSMKYPYVIISSALALTPIYMFFETELRTVILGYWGLIYYLVFIGSYFVISLIKTRNAKKANVNKMYKIFKWISIGLTTVFVLHTVAESVSLYNCEECSAPWHLAIIMNVIIYVIPLTVVYVLFINFYLQNKKSTLKINTK